MIKQVIRKSIQVGRKSWRRINKLKVKRLEQELNCLPINEGDSLFIHSRLSTVGFLEEGPTWYLNYFRKRLGENGNLLMPSFSGKGYSYDYLKENPLFNPGKTPSQMGILTREFMALDGIYRSFHPTHSVLCSGPNAKEITQGHEIDSNPFNEHSPFYKFLMQKNPKVLCLGMTLFPATIFRVYESLVYPDYPVKVFLDEEVEYQLQVEDDIKNLKTLVHNPEASGKRRNMLFENKLLESGVLNAHKIGQSKSYLLDASGFLEFMEVNFQKGNLPYMEHYQDFERDRVEQERLFKQWETI